MATQTITARFRTEGADRVAKQTEQITKAQTRLGQASASAGRSFSSQAQGLGGVVGVYAAAAANVFALTAAFSALNRAAQFETILRGTESLANAVGTNADSVVKSLQNITAGQLSVIESATQANLALSAGFNIDQINELGTVALKASRALGRNLTDAFQRITRGAIKLEPELLDEIGIFTRIDPAVEAYAASLNKSANSLTQFEKRQAFVNQVIKDGQAAFSDIQDVGGSTQETFERLVANFTNLALSAGKLLADALVPLAEFLDKGLGNRLALLGAVGLLVFGRLKTAIAGFATEGLVALSSRLSAVADSFANTKKQAAAFQAQALEANRAFVGGGALPGAGRGSGAEIKKQLAAGGFTTQQALSAQKEIPNLLKNEVELRKSVKANLDSGVVSQIEANKQISQSVIRTRALNKVNQLVTAQLGASTVAAKLFAKALNGAAVAAGILGAVLGKAFAILNIIAIALTGLQLLGSLFDFDLVGRLTEAYKEFTKESRRTAIGIDAIVSSIDQSSPAFRSLQTDLGETTEEIRETIKAGTDLADSNRTRLVNSLNLLEKQLQALKDGGFLGFLASDLRTAFSGDNTRQVKELEQSIRNIKFALTDSAQETGVLALAIGTLREKSDVGAKSLGEVFARDLLNFDASTKKVTLSLRDGVIELGKFEDGVLTLSEGIEPGAAVAADFVAKLEDLDEKLASGQISADKAGSSFGILANQAAKAIDLLERDFPEAAAIIRDALDEARESTGAVVERVVALDQFGKKLSKTFGGAFKAVDDALISGNFSGDGGFAKTAEQAALNQALLLKDLNEQAQIELDLNALGEAGLQTETEKQALIETQSKIQKITAGNQIQLLKTLEKQKDAELKKTRAVENQLKVLKEQNELARINLEITRQQNDLAIARAQQEQNLAAIERRLEITKETVNQDNQRLDFAKSLLELESQSAVQLEKQATAQRDLANMRENADLAIKKGQADRQVTVAEAQGFRSAKEMSDLRLAAAKAATDIELAAIRQRKQAAIDDFVNQTAAVDRRIDAIAMEFDIENQRREQRKQEILAQEKLEQTKIQFALDNISAQKDIVTQEIRRAEQTRDIANLQASIAKETRLADLELQQNRAKTDKARIEADKKILEGNVKIVNGMLKAAGLLTDQELGQIEVDATGINTANIDSIIEGLGKQVKATEGIFKEQVEAARLAESVTISNLAAKNEQLNIERKGLEDQKVDSASLTEKRLEGLQLERTLAQQILDEKLSLADLEKQSIQDQLILKMEQAGIDRERAITALEYAKTQAAYELSQQARLDAALTASQGIVENQFTGALTKLNEQLVEGSLTMGSIGDTFKNMLGNMLKEIQATVFKKTIAEPISEGIASFLPKLFNSGGLVHLAAGGTLKRDRVPAMLEPGEFVIRKEAAKKLGMSKLAQMNAGVTPDPIAMLIARLSGSKVRGMVPGGDVSAFGGGAPDVPGGIGGGPGVTGGSKGTSGGTPGLGGSQDAGSGFTSSIVNSGIGGGGADQAALSAAQKFIAGGGNPFADSSQNIIANQLGKQGFFGPTKPFSDDDDPKSDPKNSLKAKAGKSLLDFAISAALFSNPFTAAGLVAGIIQGQFVSSATEKLTGQKGLGFEDAANLLGMQKKAAGGLVRDRVPAMLEPGEFVIRKPMAKALGGAVLNQMNSTGKPPEVSVNVNNSGAPKDVSVKPPKMNGDKVIIDLITRDLKNNGAIKKSMRKR